MLSIAETLITAVNLESFTMYIAASVMKCFLNFLNTIWCLLTMHIDIYVYITQPNAKCIPNYDVLFANGELHQAGGHVTLLMNT